MSKGGLLSFMIKEEAKVELHGFFQGGMREMSGRYLTLSYFTSKEREAKQREVRVKVVHPRPPNSLYTVNLVSGS